MRAYSEGRGAVVAMFIYPFVVVAGLLIMGVIAFVIRQRGWLILITAMVVALIFGIVFARPPARQFQPCWWLWAWASSSPSPQTLRRWGTERSR